MQEEIWTTAENSAKNLVCVGDTGEELMSSILLICNRAFTFYTMQCLNLRTTTFMKSYNPFSSGGFLPYSYEGYSDYQSENFPRDVNQTR